MAKVTAAAGLMLFLILALPGGGQAFRCGSGLVNVGDSSGKVLIECGPPTSKEVVGAKSKGTSAKGAVGKEKKRSVESGSHRKTSGKVEKWFYNCGEHDFIYVLTFEGGKLTKERTEGYGKGKSDCLGRR